MAVKIAMLKVREVYEIVLRPVGKKIVGSKWVYVVKWKENRGLEKCKARTVAKGFT